MSRYTRSLSRTQHSEATPPAPFSDASGYALPVPMISRNRQPRSRGTSLARSIHSASGSRSASRGSFQAEPVASGSATQSSAVFAHSSYASSSTLDLSSGGHSMHSQPVASSSQASNNYRKRQRSVQPKRRVRSRRDPDDDLDTESDEEEVDQLISDSDDIAISLPTVPVLPSLVGQSQHIETETETAQPPAQRPPSRPSPTSAARTHDTVSSPSLAKLLNSDDIPLPSLKAAVDAHAIAGPSSLAAKPEPSSTPIDIPSVPQAVTTPEPLSEYTCPICFFPPTNAAITPCGHVCCGQCLFTAVKTTLARGSVVAPLDEPNVARCPVCRAAIPGWDGRGGGVIGLKIRAIFSI